jgi:preprotein translocase subunit SecE
MKRQAVARGSIFSRLNRYFREVISELRKVVWPTREETRRLTVLVIIVSVAVGLFLGAIDYGFTQLIGLFLPG